jgi:hypothetical protein
MTTPNPIAGNARAGIEQISNMIEAARRLIGEGHLVDLRLLESRVDGFCGSLRNVPTEMAAELRPAMLALIDELGRLEQEIRRIQTETAAKLGDTIARRRAATAYTSTPASSARPQR